MKIKLKEILEEKRISAYKLSEATGISANSLGKIINGKTTSIRYDNLEKICYVLGIEPNDIFEIEEPDLPIIKEISDIVLKYQAENKSNADNLFNSILGVLGKENPKVLDMNSMQQVYYVSNFITNNYPKVFVLQLNNLLFNTYDDDESNDDYIAPIPEVDKSKLHKI
jgi:putative transcriptional regulator